MAVQLSAGLRNQKAASYEAIVGTSPKLQIRTGTQPANCAAASSGTLLCEITLPSDWLAAPSNGAVALNGTWLGAASATGTAGHYRILDSTGATCHEQGSITVTGGGGDLEVGTTAVSSGTQISVTTFVRTEGGA